jgi:hypothetical protein
MTILRSAFHAIVLLLVAAAPARGQYYDEEENAPPGDRFITAGVMWRTFEPRPSNPRPDSLAIRFESLMPLLAFRQGLVDVYIGYTAPESGETAIVAGTTVSTDLPLVRSRTSALLLPIILSADFTKVTSGGAGRDDFNVGSLGIGAGLAFRWRGSRAAFWVQGGEVIHLAFEGFAGKGGSSVATIAEAGVLFSGVGIGEGLALTYRFRMQSWTVGDGLSDYTSTYHGPSIGVIF